MTLVDKNICVNELRVDITNIEVAVNKLHKTCALDCEQLTIMYVLYEHPALFVLLKVLLNNMIAFSVTPTRFNHNVILPTVKETSRSVNDPCNYHPISITPICAKISEACIEPVLGRNFVFHQNQLGFVSKWSSNKALFTVKSTIEYFSERNRNVFFALLDAVKAFDRVNHYYIISCMLKRGFPEQIVKFFFSWFYSMYASDKWNNVTSTWFMIKTGVPQGGRGNCINYWEGNCIN